jgi:hypothetical protein
MHGNKRTNEGIVLIPSRTKKTLMGSFCSTAIKSDPSESEKEIQPTISAADVSVEMPQVVSTTVATIAAASPPPPPPEIDEITMPALQLKLGDEVKIYFRTITNTTTAKKLSKTEDWVVCAVSEAAGITTHPSPTGTENKLQQQLSKTTTIVRGTVRLTKTVSARKIVALDWLQKRLKNWPEDVSAKLQSLIIREDHITDSLVPEIPDPAKFASLCGIDDEKMAAAVYKEYRDGYQDACDRGGVITISSSTSDGKADPSSLTYSTYGALLQAKNLMKINEASLGQSRPAGSTHPMDIEPGTNHRVTKIVRITKGSHQTK